MQAPPKLTKRERQILPYLLSGATRNEIATTLGIAPDTVKIHVKNLLEKFDAATVRDGFKSMNLYQQYYGISGLGADRFIHSADLSVRLLDGCKSFNVTTSIDLSVIQGEIQKLYFSQLSLNHVEAISATGVRLEPPRLQDGRMYFGLVPPAPLVEGDRLQYSFTVSVAATATDKLTEYFEETSFPATQRSYELVMTDGSGVSEYGYEVFSGMHKLTNYQLTVEKTQTSIKYIDTDPQVPLRFKLWWQ